MRAKHLLAVFLFLHSNFGGRCIALRRIIGDTTNTVVAFSSSSSVHNIGKQLKNSHSKTTKTIPKFCSFGSNQSNLYGTPTNGSNNDNEKKPTKSGYKFGDFTKSFVRKITKKEDYEFGDLSKYIDQQAKSKVNQLTVKEKYEFGDLSRYIDSRVKEEMSSFTNKEGYEFGDVTKEILRKVASRDFDWRDMVTLMKVLLSFGVGLNPISSFLPIKFLIELLNYSIAADVGDRFIGAITMEIDKRMKKALTGDPEYQVGDLSKKAILSYLGKDKYDFGDVTKKVLTSFEETKKADGKQDASALISFLGEMDERATHELEAWDSKMNLAEEMTKNNENKPKK